MGNEKEINKGIRGKRKGNHTIIKKKEKCIL